MGQASPRRHLPMFFCRRYDGAVKRHGRWPCRLYYIAFPLLPRQRLQDALHVQYVDSLISVGVRPQPHGLGEVVQVVHPHTHIVHQLGVVHVQQAAVVGIAVYSQALGLPYAELMALRACSVVDSASTTHIYAPRAGTYSMGAPS